MKKLLHLLILIVAVMACGSQRLAAAQIVTVTVAEGYVQPSVKQNIEAESSALLSAFYESALADGKKLNEKLRAFFDMKDPGRKELLTSLKELWKNSPIISRFYQIDALVMTLSGGRGYQIRNIPVLALEADDGSEYQNLVLDFDTEGHLVSVNFSLDKHNYRDVIYDDIPVEDEARRQVILNFLEVYRTAYNRRDIEYLEQVYSDDALFITGRLLTKKKTDTHQLMVNLGNVEVEYQLQSKKEYLTELRATFKHNRYVNVQFEDVKVVKHSKHPKLYGVTIKQHWKSSTGDMVGWLFLMVNFEDELRPSIEVRTWQPVEWRGLTVPLHQDKVFSIYDFDVD